MICVIAAEEILAFECITAFLHCLTKEIFVLFVFLFSKGLYIVTKSACQTNKTLNRLQKHSFNSLKKVKYDVYKSKW